MANTVMHSSPRGGNLWDWDPFRSLFSSGFTSGFTSLGVDMRKTDEGYTVEIPVPGFRPEDIELTYEEGVITVSGRSGSRSITRAFTVPDDVEADSIDANVEHGLLTLNLKRGPEAQPRRIPVRAIEGSAQSRESKGQLSRDNGNQERQSSETNART